jgi:hypothetical protein
MDQLEFSGVPTNEAEADALLSQIEAPSTERQTAQESAPPVAEQPSDQEPEYAIKWRGEEIKVPLSKLKNYAQQAYDYNRKMQEFNTQRSMFTQERDAFETSRKNLEQKLAQYEEIDSYIKENPQWWDHVNQTWHSRGTEGTQPQFTTAIEELKKQISELGNQVSTITQREKLIAQAKEDAELDQHIQEYKQKHSDLDWNSQDETGLDLERRITQFAIDNNIGNWMAAANHMLMEQFLKSAELKAKESVGKTVQKAHKQGLGPVTDHPITQLKTARAVRNKSYDELGQEALAEFGIT